MISKTKACSGELDILVNKALARGAEKRMGLGVEGAGLEPFSLSELHPLTLPHCLPPTLAVNRQCMQKCVLNSEILHNRQLHVATNFKQ